MSILKNLFNSNDRELRKIGPTVDSVARFEPTFERTSDSDLQRKTGEFRERISRGEPMDKILPEAFAVVREVSRRVLDMRHFDVQILGGVVLHQGRIAEMQTGEGKTLVATLPAYLNAIGGATVHVVTVNDYLAKRDREWMGQIYRFLGLDVGLVIPGMEVAQKKASYSCPIIYGTNTEFGFDYLRDNMAWRKDDLVQSPLNYAIIDEVDSILIDEARTPLIISGRGEGTTDKYIRFRDLARMLKRDKHYTVDEKAKTIVLTDEGIERTEEWLGIDDLSDEGNIGLEHYVKQALRAKELMHRDVDYVVKNGEVLIVDEFTGRILVGRRFSDGLHQAIEAKEGVEIKEESDTLATITVQNFFRMYDKLSGMTGTAATEEPEFLEIYGLDVVCIPPNKSLIRTNMPDSIWKTEGAKFEAVVEEIDRMHQVARPVLVGTRSVEKSEMLSAMLKRRGIDHEVLNAKHHEREAEIVAQAGRKGSVTIATNMAGRGTDILLGGNPDFMARSTLRKEGYDADVVSVAAEKVLPQAMLARIEAGTTDEHIEAILAARDRYKELFEQFKKVTDEEHEEVVSLGGLHVLGTERHEARRIDNQLRGRAGRQGDPGSSRFYLSLDDELMRLFGGDLISGVMEKVGFSDDEAIEHPLITKSVETAQKRIEAHNFSIRKNVLEYDNVLNKQREVIYSQRRQVLEFDDLSDIVRGMIAGTVERGFGVFWNQGERNHEADTDGLVSYLKELMPAADFRKVLDSAGSRQAALDAVMEVFSEGYKEKAEMLGPNLNEVQRLILLRVVDQKWIDQLRAMEGLREGIGLRAYGQRDPLLEYQKEGYDLFQNMIENIEKDTVAYFYRVTVSKERGVRAAGDGQGAAGPVRVIRLTGPQSQDTEGREQVRPGPVKSGKKVGRNDPCPCGSGKKYKNCCGKLG
ncbi:MAG: preprotein translocase subunit SecA [Firmicutes bacterium]|nr:preprotein translocase subunit SecA [Candidatus Fermentithermobacillaceae bacterium]